MRPVMKLTNHDMDRLRAPKDRRSERAALDYFLDEVEENVDNIRDLLTLIEGDIVNIRKEIKNDT